MISLDEKDLQLIKIISQNARISGIELSKMLEISPSTVTRKIKSLEESGVIKGYLAIIDNEIFGKKARSALTIKLTGGVEINHILDELKQNEDICNIFETMGNYDILLTYCNTDETQIYEFIKKIRSMDGVLFVDFTSIVSSHTLSVSQCNLSGCTN